MREGNAPAINRPGATAVERDDRALIWQAQSQGLSVVLGRPRACYGKGHHLSKTAGQADKGAIRSAAPPDHSLFCLKHQAARQFLSLDQPDPACGTEFKRQARLA